MMVVGGCFLRGFCFSRFRCVGGGFRGLVISKVGVVCFVLSRVLWSYRLSFCFFCFSGVFFFIYVLFYFWV